MREESGRLRVQVQTLIEERDTLQAQIRVQKQTMRDNVKEGEVFKESVERIKTEFKSIRDEDQKTMLKWKKRIASLEIGYTLAWMIIVGRDSRAKKVRGWIASLVSDGIDAYGEAHKEGLIGLVWDELILGGIETPVEFDPEAVLGDNILRPECIPDDLNQAKLLELLNAANIPPYKLLIYVPIIAKVWLRLDGAHEFMRLIDPLLNKEHTLGVTLERHRIYHKASLELLERGPDADAGAGSVDAVPVVAAPADAP